MEFRGNATYRTEHPLREARLWTSFAAVSADGLPVEVRALHADEPAKSSLEQRLNILQAIRSLGVLCPVEWQAKPSGAFVVVERVSAVTATEFRALATAQILGRIRSLFVGLSELHRNGLIAGSIQLSHIVGRRDGSWSLDVMECWSEPTQHDDPEEDVRQLCECCRELIRTLTGTLTGTLTDEHRILLTPDSATLQQRLLTASFIADRLSVEQPQVAAGGTRAGEHDIAVDRTFVTAVIPAKNDADQTFVADITPTGTGLTVPEMLGRFRIHERLGEGAVGAVYRGVDSTTGATVAIKILNDRTARNPSMIRRFTKEARMLSKADSPFVARLIDSNHDQGVHFLALEYLPGGTLSSVLRGQKRLSEKLALRLILDVARGLAVAHQESVFHRDIKPDNILLTARGARAVDGLQNATSIEQTSSELRWVISEGEPLAKLSDFGLAKSLDQSESMAMTQDGAILGTPLYMSPEQCRGLVADARSDIYSLGATLFHLLAGRPPFSGESQVAVMNAHCSDPTPSLHQIRPELSDACCVVVEKCLQKNADARYVNGEALAADLERLLHGEPTSIAIHPAPPSTQGLGLFEHSFSCELRSSSEQLWPYVSHTDRVNHALGLSSVTYTTRRHPERGVERFAEARVAGQKLAWQEHPYEWIEGKRLSVLREFSSGPFLWFMNIVELQQISGGGTRLTQTLKAVPRNFAGRMLCRLELGRRTPRAFQKVYQQVDEFLQRGASPATDAFGARIAMTAGGRRRLEQRIQSVASAGTDPSVTETLRQFLENASDLEVARIRPLVFAERFQLSADEVIRACLLGAREGLLLHLWDILCPSCRIPADVQETLASLKDHAYCPACDLKYTVDFASSVELIFRAHPDVRPAETRTYCIGGPAFSAHVVAQIRLAPGERFDLPVALTEGTYRLRGPQLPFVIDLVVSAGRGASRAEFSMLRPPVPGTVPVFRAGQQVLVLHNTTGQDLQIRLERTAGRSQALTAAAASAMPLFRELFPNDVLAPGQIVSITSVTLLMAELCTAESLYASIGDGPAFGKIRTKLLEIEEGVRSNGGAVVKIVGEGVLAVFQSTPAAVQAAVTLMKKMDLNELPLRTAIDHGPAMVTTLNDRLDYFGATVARTRRLLEFAGSGELLIPSRVAIDEELQNILHKSDAQSSLRVLDSSDNVITAVTWSR
ncbi:MAG: protein kinase [Planctomycetaceae bacterium]|nr:protein kinase [Planctomycetaceae bacterium]